MKSKRVLALLLSATLLSGVFAGCSQKSGTSSNAANSGTGSNGSGTPDYMNPVGQYPITKDKITLTVLGKKDPGGTDWGDLEVFKDLEKTTNIHLDFTLAEGDTFTEKKNLDLAGGKYTDLILRGGSVSKTDEETYGPQGIFLDLTSLINNYAPNIKSLLETNKTVKASVTAMDSHIYGLPYYFTTATLQGHQGFYDSAWMKNVGIDKEPTTTDELYTMLQAFKDKDVNNNGDANDEIPFSCVGVANMKYLMGYFTGMTGGIGFDINDAGEVVYVPALASYKDFLTYANKMYKNGLLDPEFSTQTSQQWQAKVKGGLVGIYNASPTLLDASTKSQQLSLLPLTSPSNSKKVCPAPDNIYTSEAMITDNCKYPEAAIRLLDMFYAPEDKAVQGFSGLTAFIGYENKEWKYTDSSKSAYEFIAPMTSFADINKSVSVNMELPGLLNFTAMPSNNPLLQMKVNEVKEKQIPYYRSAYPVNARFTTQESEQGNTIENDLFNQVVQRSTKFIIGEESLDNFDKYLQDLNTIGLKDLLKIKTDAYARWQKAMQ